MTEPVENVTEDDVAPEGSEYNPEGTEYPLDEERARTLEQRFEDPDDLGDFAPEFANREVEAPPID